MHVRIWNTKNLNYKFILFFFKYIGMVSMDEQTNILKRHLPNSRNFILKFLNLKFIAD